MGVAAAQHFGCTEEEAADMLTRMEGERGGCSTRPGDGRKIKASVVLESSKRAWYGRCRAAARHCGLRVYGEEEAEDRRTKRGVTRCINS
jgi:hypothetical protein